MDIIALALKASEHRLHGNIIPQIYAGHLNPACDIEFFALESELGHPNPRSFLPEVPGDWHERGHAQQAEGLPARHFLEVCLLLIVYAGIIGREPFCGGHEGVLGS